MHGHLMNITAIGLILDDRLKEKKKCLCVCQYVGWAYRANLFTNFTPDIWDE